MKIKGIMVAPLGVNCYFIIDIDGQCAIIDPGGDFDKVVTFINNNSYKPAMILLTHGHFDHIGAAQELKDKYNIPLYAHEDELWLLKVGSKQSESYGLPPFDNPVPTKTLKDGDKVMLNKIQIQVIHTPGHSTGGVCYYLPDYGVVFTGDTLFARSVGRTDFEGCSAEKLVDSIKQKLYKLPDNTVVYPGHGVTTSIGDEKVSNPFVTA